ncbi:MAG: serine/threonine protein kinase, partial [Planctomycetes bacterium]|nr:serine/threonine protein kinase [Planctomycetota bacterium]
MQIEKLGPYRIDKQIGKGGMGAVYEATDESPGDQQGMRVAVKALHPQLASAEGFRERFEAEIESLKKLRHECIVRLYGYGEQDGILFYSMELVEGASLEEELAARRHFDWRETVEFGIQICRALKHAHDHGVVHRDIKPANLLLTPDGQIKIADFGIARLFGGTQLTLAGGVLGTADYMSPEQADGRVVSEKCDQYSLGGVLYALLAGRPPFRAKTMPEMLQMQRFAEPEPVRRYAPDTPDQLDRLISQLLAKEPADRFPNVLVLGRHMKAMKQALSQPPKKEPKEEGQGAVDTKIGSSSTNVSSSATADFDQDATQSQNRPPLFSNEGFPSGGETDEAMQELFDAPTLAEPTKPSSSQTKSASAPKPEPKRRFTTLDEEVCRQREQARGSRVGVAAQRVAMAAALGILIWGGWQLMQPPTAEKLYKKIIAEVDERGTENLRVIAGELNDFFERFPEDPRAEEIERYRHQLEFQKFERQAQRKSRTAGAEETNPVESIYFSA